MFSYGLARNFLATAKTFSCSSTLSSKIFQDARILQMLSYCHTSVVLNKDLGFQSHHLHTGLCSTRKNASKHKPKQKYQYVWDDEENIFFRMQTSKENIVEKIRLVAKQFTATSLVNRASPTLKPYLQLIRADKQIGTMLLYFPCAFSICLATPTGTIPSLYYLGLFGVGAFLMRGAGCIINDLWDRDFDKRVDRTKDRPLASGAIATKNAVKLLAFHLTLSLGILLSLNSTCIMIGFASMLPVILYPLAKRFTYFPQLVLGLTFNIGAVMGYAAVTGQIDWAIIGPLYGSCILWTMYYDTIYAFQDIKDDEHIGVKSTARLFTRRSDYMELSISDRMQSEKKRRNKINGFLTGVLGGHLMLMGMAGWSVGLEGPFSLAIIVCTFRAIFEIFNCLFSNLLMKAEITKLKSISSCNSVNRKRGAA